MKIKVVLLDKGHNRSEFKSSSEELNRYFHKQVSQDIRRKVTTCYVALNEEEKVGGYFTLASSSIFLGDLPESLTKKLPRYPTVPAVRMGKLAVDETFKGQGLGAALLAEALTRSANSEIAAFAMVVDAKDEKAASFYNHFGFIALKDMPLTLFLPLGTALQI